MSSVTTAGEAWTHDNNWLPSDDGCDARVSSDISSVNSITREQETVWDMGTKTNRQNERKFASEDRDLISRSWGWESGPSSLRIYFESGLFKEVNGAARWEARLNINASDIPSLMRRGLHIDEQNLIPELGYIEESDVGSAKKLNLQWERHYSLRDRDPNGRKWCGTLTVVAKSVGVLRDFRISDLRCERVLQCKAHNPCGKACYEYHREQPQQCYNAVYDDMPLEGLWPWPKREAE